MMKMRNPKKQVRSLRLAAIVWLMFGAVFVQAQQIIPVSSGSALTAAINQAYANSLAGSGTTTIVLGANITGTSQMIINANVIIEGNGYTLNMNNADRAFFVAGGTVAMSNLTITNGNATGGSGLAGSGGGAGLGGAIFVGSGTYNGADGTVAAVGLSVPQVSLANVSFQNNTAIGGAGSTATMNSLPAGGGGMGGDGAVNGGGGFGTGASGGLYGGVTGENAGGTNGGAGAFINITGANTTAGPGGDGNGGAGGAGGLNGGGGGGGGYMHYNGGTGGGGGLGGAGGHYDNGNLPDWGGSGGFGGGGGAGVTDDGGFGGFGGGGGMGGGVMGGGSSTTPGGGGFGGGGAGQYDNDPIGSGGFGGGDGSISDYMPVGGGGLGAGGALFVMAGANVTISGGTFSQNTVTPGAAATAGNPGSAYGADIFLGGDVTFNVTGTLSLNSLGGAGNPGGDPNVESNANDPNAQGGITVQGPGTLVLTGTSYYTGATVINSGTLLLAAGAKEQGTTSVVVGQNHGDNGTLLLGNGSTLNMSGTAQVITLGQSGSSTGTVLISTGGAGVVLGEATINGGVGGGTVIFDELNGVTGTGAYPMYSNLTGNLSVVQNGSATTILSPYAVYGANTYTGGTTINAGVLQVGSGSGIAQGLPSGGAVTVNGGMLDMNGQTVTVGALQVNGGNVGDSLGGGGLSAASIAAQSGTIGVRVSGSGAVVQSGSGTTTLSVANGYGGGTVVNGGVLMVMNTQGLGGGDVQVNSGTLQVAAGTAIGNYVKLSGGVYEVAVSESWSYAGMADATSDFGNGRSTSASLLAGFSSTGGWLSTSFAASSEALNDGLRQSDVYSLVGTGGDIYVLELSMGSVGAESVLGWLNPNTHEWENANQVNPWNNASAEAMGFEGSFAAFQSAHGSSLEYYIGAYGVDVAGGAVWAVLDGGGDFAILAVPEPGSVGLLAGGLLFLVMHRPFRRRCGIVSK